MTALSQTQGHPLQKAQRSVSGSHNYSPRKEVKGTIPGDQVSAFKVQDCFAYLLVK